MARYLITGLAYVRNINEKQCLKVCVKLNYAKGKGKKMKTINRISTIGKVEKYNLEKDKFYKKIE